VISLSDKLKIAFFESKAEIYDSQEEGDFKHPLLTSAKFVFADDQGNNNHQGIQESEFNNIIRSSIGTPVKMKFLGMAAGHEGSIPIGHIRTMTKITEGDTNKLVADATLYADEFPDEIQYLKDAYAAGDAPGISYELLYSESEESGGIEWLKKVITKAATFVRHPAYGSRTALMALATDKNIDDQQFVTAVSQLASDWSQASKIEETQGGNNMTEEEIKELQAALAEAESAVNRLKEELAAKDAVIAEKDTALAETNLKVTELTDKIATAEKEAVKAARIARVTEAGFKLGADDEAIAKKQDFLVGLSEEAFETYITDLVEAKKTTQTASASDRSTVKTFLPVPRPIAVASSNGLDKEGLKAGLKSLSRPS